MSPSSSSGFSLIRCFPRVSGDEPVQIQLADGKGKFSPRERG